MVTLTIDGQQVSVAPGTTILEAARKVGVNVPTLCHHPDQAVKGVCRVCVVEIQGARTFQTACTYPVSEGLVVRTASPALREARRTIVELMLATHPDDCLKCERNLRCELQDLAAQLGVREISFPRLVKDRPEDLSSPSVLRDPAKCISCRRCMYACNEVQEVGILHPINRGWESYIAPAWEKGLMEINCTLCGQCIHACPVGAIYEKDSSGEVWAALADPKKHVVVQTAPAIRVSLGEELGLPIGSIATGRMVAGLRRLGFDKVFDTNFTADLTILEEGSEFIDRLTNGGVLPLITSCSPGWIKYIEHFYPDLLPNVSTCKSPQQMFGALAKTYYAEKSGIPAEDIYVVSVMPCTAKKFEAARPEMNSSGYQDVDAVLTTRELGRMLRESGVDLATLSEEDYDSPLGISTGAAVIFGATGGVMEAALRTAYELITNKELPSLDFVAVRGLEGVKEATVDVDGTMVRVAVAHSLGNARRVMDRIASGESDYHFVEIMACPGGCIGGGGQPIPTTTAVRLERIRAIYEADQAMELRKSHDNPAVAELYREFLGKPLGHRSHELLHTHYTKRSRY